MPRARAPWWMYVVAASFLGLSALQIYTAAWGPGPIGMNTDFGSGSMVVQNVVPNGARERAGLCAGDCIVAANGMPIRGDRDWEVASANFEIGQPTRLEIERGGLNYRRLEDVNERRRVRVLLVGSVLGWLGAGTFLAHLGIGTRLGLAPAGALDSP